MIYEDEYGILSNPDILNEEYLPARIPGREPQIKELSFCISPAIKGKKPINAWIFGKPGTGKTSTCRYILRKLENESNVRGVYVNCWENPTFFAVLDKIIRELRILGAEKLNTSFKFERLQKHLKDKPFIIFLDEIDQPPHRERDDIIYHFCNLPNLGIIAICNSKYVLYSLDERIKSRVNAQRIEFKPYLSDDLLFILQKRAALALAPDAYKDATLERIAGLAEGDARIAIQTLKNAAYLAEKEDSKTIRDAHIKRGYNSAKDLKKTYLLNKLTEHHRMLYDIIRKNGEIKSGSLWESYLAKCHKSKIRPIALRTFSEYTRKLIEMDLVRAERALVKGKVRIFRIN